MLFIGLNYSSSVMVIKMKNGVNDKELEEIPEVKKYFARIYSVLSKNVREQLNNLDISKDRKKQLKKELAFLPKHKQIKYLEEIIKQYGLKFEEN